MLVGVPPDAQNLNSISFWRGSIYLARIVVNRAPQGWGVLILLCTHGVAYLFLLMRTLFISRCVELRQPRSDCNSVFAILVDHVHCYFFSRVSISKMSVVYCALFLAPPGNPLYSSTLDRRYCTERILVMDTRIFRLDGFESKFSALFVRLFRG